MTRKMSIMSGLIALALTGLAGRAMAATESADGTITVQPGFTLQITVTGTIALGQVEVNTAKFSSTGQALANLSAVGVNVTAKIHSPGTWTVGTSTGALDTFVLRALAGSTDPGNSAVHAATPLSGTVAAALGNATDLKAAGQTGDNTNIWYEIDMPTTVSASAAQTITVTYTAAAN